MIPPTPTFTRYAGPTERRCIIREELGFYNSLAAGALYKLQDGAMDLGAPETYFGGLRNLVEKHPSLVVTVQDAHTEKPFFARVPDMDLRDHVRVIADGKGHLSDIRRIEEVLPSILDERLPQGRPLWEIVVLPLTESGAVPARCFVTLHFSHAIGDGATAMIFHRGLLAALQERPFVATKLTSIKTPNRDLLPEFDTAERLPVSLGFMLRPLLGWILPKFMLNLLGLQATISGRDETTWTGPPTFLNPKATRTNVLLLELEAPVVERARRIARMHDAKLTGTIQVLIVRALSRAVQDPRARSFVGQNTINMRHLVGGVTEEMGIYVNGYHEKLPRMDPSLAPLNEEAWAAASSTTKKLTEFASSLSDQPVGLLRFVPDMKGYLQGRIGQTREGSFEMSNCGAFAADSSSKTARITKMVFTQPCNPISFPLVFTIVGVNEGSLIAAINWQSGALGVPLQDERDFVAGVISSIRKDMETLK